MVLPCLCQAATPCIQKKYWRTQWAKDTADHHKVVGASPVDSRDLEINQHRATEHLLLDKVTALLRAVRTARLLEAADTELHRAAGSRLPQEAAVA